MSVSMLLLFGCLLAVIVAASSSNATVAAADLEALRADLQGKIDEMAASNDRTWMLSSAFTILQMQAGFAMLEAGSTSSTSTASILMKNMADLAVGTIGFYLIGWGFAFGPSDETQGISTNAFIGTGDFALSSPGINHASWVFQLSFAATAATIVSGAVAGRIKFKLYVILSLFVTALIYPIPAHWAWDSRGFGYSLGFVDFAGSAVVHAAGGLMGLMSTVRLGPRTGVFSESGAYFPVRSSPTTAILGVFILIWCWFSFNAGSTTSVSNGADKVASLAAVNTAMASGAGSVAGMAYSWFRSGGKYIDVYETANGSLCALVGITAGCASVLPWEASIIGLLAAVLGNWVTTVLVRFRIDDPVGVTPVHLCCGVFGTLMVGLFANDPTLQPDLPVPQVRAGLFHGGGFEQLGVQSLLVVCILAWSFVSYGLVLLLLDKTLGLRVTLAEERMLDALEHNLLMVKVQEAFGGTGSTEGMSDDEDELLDRYDAAEQGRRVHPGGSGRMLAAQGQLMTMDAGLDRQPQAVTVIQEFDEADAAEDGSGLRKRGAAQGAANLAKAAGPGGALAVSADVSERDLTEAVGSLPPGAKGAVDAAVSRGNRRRSVPASGFKPRRSTSSGARRGKRSAKGRRRSMTYMREEVTYMTAEELAAVHSGKMDETTVDRAMPAAISKHMGSSTAHIATPSADSAANSATSATDAPASSSKPTAASADTVDTPGPDVTDVPAAEDSSAVDRDAKSTAAATTHPAGPSDTAGAAPNKGRGNQRQGSRRGPRRTGSRAVMEVPGWQAPGAVGGNRLPGREGRSRRSSRVMQYQAQGGADDGTCAQQ